MASFLFDIAKEIMLGDGATRIDLDADVIKVRAVNSTTDYTPVITETTMTPVTAYLSSTDPTITISTLTASNGIVDGTDLTPAWTALAQNSTDLINGLVIYKFVTNDAGSTPICHIDLTTSITPNGGDINITWNGSGIFSI